MPVTLTVIATGRSSALATAVASPSVHPTTSPGKVLLAVVDNMSTSPTPATVSVEAFGQTWTQVQTGVLARAQPLRGSLFRSSGSTVTTGAATFKASGATTSYRWMWAIYEADGLDTAAPIVQSTFAVSTVLLTTAFTVSLDPLGTTLNPTVGLFSQDRQLALTTGADQISLGFTSVIIAGGIEWSKFDEWSTAGTTAITANNFTLARGALGIAAELKAAVSTVADERHTDLAMMGMGR